MAACLHELRSPLEIARLPRRTRGARLVALTTAVGVNVFAVAVLVRAHSAPHAKPSSLPLVATIMLPERPPPPPLPREPPKPKPLAKPVSQPIEPPPVIIQQDIPPPVAQSNT